MQSLDNQITRELHALPIPPHSPDLVQRIIAASEVLESGHKTIDVQGKNIFTFPVRSRWAAGIAVAACLALAIGVMQYQGSALAPGDGLIQGVDMLADVDFDEKQIYAGLVF